MVNATKQNNKNNKNNKNNCVSDDNQENQDMANDLQIIDPTDFDILKKNPPPKPSQTLNEYDRACEKL